MNPFAIILAVLNLGAALYEFKHRNPKMGITYICYAVATIMLGLQTGKSKVTA